MKKLFLALAVLLSVSGADDRMKIYFEAGSVGDNFSTVISNGAKAAAKDLNVDLKVMYSEWNPNKMIENFKTALAASPSGIVVMGIRATSCTSR